MQFETDKIFNTKVSELFSTIEPDIDKKSKNNLETEILNCLSNNKAKNTKKNNLLKLYPEFTKICKNDFTEELKEKWNDYLKNKKEYNISKLKNNRHPWYLLEGKQCSFINDNAYYNKNKETRLYLNNVYHAFICYIYPTISYEYVKEKDKKNISDLLDISINIGFIRSIKTIHSKKYDLFFENNSLFSYKKSETDYDEYSNFLIFPIFVKDFYAVYNENIKEDYILDREDFFELLKINNKIKNKLFAYILSTIIYSNGKTIKEHIANKNKKLLRRTLEKLNSPGGI